MPNKSSGFPPESAQKHSKIVYTAGSKIQRNKTLTALMSSSNCMVQGGKLIFGQLEVPSTKIVAGGRQNKHR